MVLTNPILRPNIVYTLLDLDKLLLPINFNLSVHIFTENDKEIRF